MTAIKNRYDFVFLFDVEDGNPSGDPDFDNMPRTDKETDHELVADVYIKRKIRNYVQLPRGLKSPYDIFVRGGNVLNTIIDGKRVETDKKEEDEKRVVKLGRDEMYNQYFDIRAFDAVVSTSNMKADDDSSKEKAEEGGKGKKSKKEDSKKEIKELSVVRGPVQLTFARSIDPVDAKSHSLTRRCVTTKDENKDGHISTIGNKNTISHGLCRIHDLTSAIDVIKTGFSEEDKEILFNAIISTFENDHAAAREEMSPKALVVFKHKSPLGDARAGQLFDLIQVNKRERVGFPRSFGDHKVTPRKEIEAILKNRFPNVAVKELV